MRLLFVSAIIVLVDQLTKILTKKNMALYESIPIIGDFFRLTYVENPGMAFGIQLGPPLFFITFSVLATIGIFVYFVLNRHRPFSFRFALSFILGGAVGNLIDRLAYGKVVDFADFGFGAMRWPVFNIADSAVTIGMIILFFLIIFEKNENEEMMEPTMSFGASEPPVESS